MIQSLHQEDTAIERIVQQLVARFRPECIYLFGSRARGDHRPGSDYDVYMEVAPENWPEDEYHTRNGVLIGFREAQVHVRVPGTLRLDKDEPGRIMYDVAREGIVLFRTAQSEAVVPSDPPGRIRERPARRNALVEEWLRLAQVDHDLVEHLSTDIERWKEPICFHAQQSAEKFLKALTTTRSRRVRHVHDMGDLLEYARVFGYHLGGIDRRCRSLTRYAVEGRYPDVDRPTLPANRRISVDDARRAIEDARAVRNAVERELP